MATAKITLFGMADYMQNHENDLFAGFNILPALVVKDHLINMIMRDGGEFEVLYSDPYFLKDQITSWVHQHNRTFNKWADALQIKYDPLNNYDRYETWADHAQRENSDIRTGSRAETGNDSRSETGSSAERENGSGEKRTENDSITNNMQRADTGSHSDTTDTVSAFNSSAYVPNNKSVNDTDSGTVNTAAGSTKGSGTETDSTGADRSSIDSRSEHADRTSTGTDTSAGRSAGADQSQHVGHMYGNIGVTTSQQMLEAEMQVAEWNLYQHITDLFLQAFTIPVYI